MAFGQDVAGQFIQPYLPPFEEPVPFCHVDPSDAVSPSETPETRPDPGAPGPAPEPGTGVSPAPAPGYVPRLLSAAAHVTHLASDGALERFGLNRNTFALLELLASAPSTEGRLAEAAGRPAAAVQRALLDLRSSGYSAPDEQGTWSVTEAGLNVIECAQLAQAESVLDAEDSQELRQALRTLIASLRQPDDGAQQHPRP